MEEYETILKEVVMGVGMWLDLKDQKMFFANASLNMIFFRYLFYKINRQVLVWVDWKMLGSVFGKLIQKHKKNENKC
jgi:hypothetical protein